MDKRAAKRDDARLAKALVGRTIYAIETNRFDDGRGGLSTNPIVHLDDGSCISFSVEETEVGVYGVSLNFHVYGLHPKHATVDVKKGR